MERERWREGEWSGRDGEKGRERERERVERRGKREREIKREREGERERDPSTQYFFMLSLSHHHHHHHLPTSTLPTPGHADIPQADVMSLLSRNRFKHSVVMHVLEGEEQISKTSYPSLSLAPSVVSSFTGVVILGGGQTAIHHAESVLHFAMTNNLAIIHSCLKTSKYYQVKAKKRKTERESERERERETENDEKKEKEREREVIQILCISCQKPQVEKYSPSDHTSISFASICTSPRITSHIPEDLEGLLREVDPVTYDENPHLLVRDTPLGLALGTASVLLKGEKEKEKEKERENERERERCEIYMIGFDGYPKATKPQIEIMDEAKQLVLSFSRLHPDVVVKSLTPTHLDVEVESVYSALLKGTLAGDE